VFTRTASPLRDRFPATAFGVLVDRIADDNMIDVTKP
jgi:hypothetical protein